jgi:hypothetical protein
VSVPPQIAAGSTLLFTERLTGYPASLYSLAFILNLDGALVANVAAGESGDDYIVTAPAATTAGWGPGRYNWSEVLTKTSDGTVYQGPTGEVPITPNYGVSASQTATQIQLTALDAAILKVVAGTHSSVNFGGQSFTQKNITEMFNIRDRLQARVNAELRALGLSSKGGARRIVTRFTG